MKITRMNHLRYMNRLTPILVFLYFLQIFLYLRFAPRALATDVSLLLGIGLVFLIVAYQFYDHHHQVILKENYLELRFDIFKMKDEILYQNIHEIELRKKNKSFGHIVLHKRDGSICQIHHVDTPEEVVEYLMKKKSRLL